MIATDPSIYELTVGAYLAVLSNQINLDHFVEEAEDEAVLSALAVLSLAAKLLSIDRNHSLSGD